MILNNLKYAWVYFSRNKSYALLNIIGITVSFTCGLLIFIYVNYHFSFDRFHQDSERIYRVLAVDETSAFRNEGGMHANGLIPEISNQIPEVEAATRFFTAIDANLRIEDRRHVIESMFFAEPGFFQFFNFPLLVGTPGEVLTEPNTAVVSRSYARELFGDEDPIGAMVRLFDSRDFRIVGIMEDLPSNSHLQVDFISSNLPDPSWNEDSQNYLNSWSTISMNSYIKLFPGSDVDSVEARIDDIIKANQEPATVSSRLQALHNVHLRSSRIYFEVNANPEEIQKMYFFSALAVLLLFAAVCNFVNLSSAKSMSRAKEVGIRKTVGATRVQLMVQFLGESLCLVLLSAALSLVFIGSLDSLFTLSVEGGFLTTLIVNPHWIVAAMFGLVALAFLAGFYPALVLASFETAQVLRGSFSGSARGALLRKLLVVVQFTISISILAGLLVSVEQLKYLSTKSVGFDPANVIRMGFVESAQFDLLEAFQNELRQIPEVASFSNTSFAPGVGSPGKFMLIPLDGPQVSQEFLINSGGVDHQFVDLLRLNIISGQNFKAISTNSLENPILLNEAALRLFQYQNDPLGRQFRGATDGLTYTVVGVLEDFHTDSMRFAIEPLFLWQPQGVNWGNFMRINEGGFATAVPRIQAAWETVYPDYPFELRIYEEDIRSFARQEESLTIQLIQFAGIAILIACLGLYGLASFTMNQRTKEIGIRKIYGATGAALARLVLREYLLLILIATLIAWPFSYYTVNYWLTGYAYRVDINFGAFPGATAIAAFIGLLTVGSNLWRTVNINPIRALSHE